MGEKEKSDSHKERRKLMLQKYLENGIEVFSESEVLEIYLYCSMRGRNVEETSQELITRFRSLWGVLTANYNDLTNINNINESTAAQICFLKSFILLLNRRSIPPVTLDTLDKIFEFCRNNLYYSATEEGCILYLDKKYKYVTETRFFSKSRDSLSIDIREIVKTAINKNCPNVIIIHTHPNCSAEPSGVDISETKFIADILSKMSLNLVDHIIVHNEEMVSMRQTIHIDGWS